jgi:hypothetical protein
MKRLCSLILLTQIFLLCSCTPHPGSGVWKSSGENEYGINRMVVSFDGTASFTTSKNNPAQWHCFWTASSKIKSDLKCTPSTNTEQEENYTLTVDDQDIAQLKHNGQQIALFVRQDENPSPRE